MTIPELLARLTKLWPNGGTEAWESEYRSVLKPFAGDPLAKAWGELIGSWDKGFPPRPADIRKHCRYPDRRSGEVRHVTGKDGWAQVHARETDLIDGWYRDHPEIVSEAHRDGWGNLLRDQIRKIACLQAQYEVLGFSPDTAHRHALDKLGLGSWLSEADAASMRARPVEWAKGKPVGKDFKSVAA